MINGKRRGFEVPNGVAALALVIVVVAAGLWFFNPQPGAAGQPSPSSIPTVTPQSGGPQLNIQTGTVELDAAVTNKYNTTAPNVSFTLWNAPDPDKVTLDTLAKTTDFNGNTYLTSPDTKLMEKPTRGTGYRMVISGNGFEPTQQYLTVSSDVNVLKNEFNMQTNGADSVTTTVYTLPGRTAATDNVTCDKVPAGTNREYEGIRIDGGTTGTSYPGPAFVVQYNQSCIDNIEIRNAAGQLLNQYSAPNRIATSPAVAGYSARMFPASEANIEQATHSQQYTMTVYAASSFNTSGNINYTSVYISTIPQQPYLCTSELSTNNICAVNGVNYQVGQLLPAAYETYKGGAISGWAADSTTTSFCISNV